MKKRYLLITIVVIISLFMSGCQCKHEWIEATLESPKMCNLCGSTEGEPLGIISVVEDSYKESLLLAKSLGKDQNYSYLLLHNEAFSTLCELNLGNYETATIKSIFGDELNLPKAKEKLIDLLTYVTADDEDHLSALMRKFSSLRSVDGTIEKSQVNIVVEDVDKLLIELGLTPESLGRILAMLDIYDYTWLLEDSESLLRFTDNGFTYQWKALTDYSLSLNDTSKDLNKGDFVFYKTDSESYASYLNDGYHVFGTDVELGEYDTFTSTTITSRGVTLGSSKKSVYTAYGSSTVIPFTNDCELYKIVSKSSKLHPNAWKKMCVEYIKYENSNYGALYFGFNANRVVNFVLVDSQ